MSRTNIHFYNKTNENIWFQTKIGDETFPTGHVNYTNPYPGRPLPSGESAIVASIGDPGFGKKSQTGSVCFAFSTIQAGINPVAEIKKGVKGHQAEGEISGLDKTYKYKTENLGQNGSTDACSVTFVIEYA